MSVNNDTISSNDAVGGAGGSGGAGGRAGIIGYPSVFHAGNGGNGGNAGPASGGAIYIAGGSVSITVTALSDNAADGGAGGDGGYGGTGMLGAGGFTVAASSTGSLPRHWRQRCCQRRSGGPGGNGGNGGNGAAGSGGGILYLVGLADHQRQYYWQ